MTGRGAQVNFRPGTSLRGELAARAAGSSASAITARDLARYYALLARGRQSLLAAQLAPADIGICLQALAGAHHETWSLPLAVERIAGAIKGEQPDVGEAFR